VSPDGKGISRVQRETVHALAVLGRHELVVWARHPEALAVPAQRVESRLTLAWEQAGLARAAREVDVVVTWTERLPLRSRARFVVWLFESPSHRITENRRRGAGIHQRASDVVTEAVWRRSLRRAAAVVTGSQATADDLVREVPGVDARPLYPGLSAGFAPGGGAGEPRYVFHLASSDPRDNSETILAAFARVQTDARLVVGGWLGRRRAALEAEIARLGLAGRVELTGRLSDDHLVRLYQGAAVYVDATLYEGFGLVPLEAMACGAPVVASSASSIPEVVGDAGLLCDPRSPADIAAALAGVLADPSLAADLRRRGIARAAQFTWERTAAELAAVLDVAVDETRA
jgi:glycosyltransferase involved in cell wall biosynthesis